MSRVEVLARHRVGDLVYRVLLRPRRQEDPQPRREEPWMLQCHPKVLYTRSNWPFKSSQGLPRVGGPDFACLMALLDSRLLVTQFQVRELRRCRHTGEMLYRDDTEWLPEPNVFESPEAAGKELSRIKQLISLWGKDQL